MRTALLMGATAALALTATAAARAETVYVADPDAVVAAPAPGYVYSTDPDYVVQDRSYVVVAPPRERVVVVPQPHGERIGGAAGEQDLLARHPAADLRQAHGVARDARIGDLDRGALGLQHLLELDRERILSRQLEACGQGVAKRHDLDGPLDRARHACCPCQRRKAEQQGGQTTLDDRPKLPI